MRYKKVQEHCKLLTFFQTLREPHGILQSKLLVYTYLLAIVSLGIVISPVLYKPKSRVFSQKRIWFFDAEYGDLEALLTGLRRKEVEGVLLDVFTASYIFSRVDNDTNMFEQVTILEYPFHIGLYMVDYHCKQCINKEIQRDQTWIYPYVLKHVKGRTVNVSI